MIKNILKKIAHFQTTHPYFTLMFLFTLTVMIWGGVSQVKTVSSLELMMPKNIEEIKAFNVLRDNYLGQDMIAIVLEINRNSSLDTSANVANVANNGIIDIRDIQINKYIADLTNILEKEKDILQIYSYSDIISFYEKNYPDLTYEEILQLDEVKSQLSTYINSDYTTTMILINTDVAGNDEAMNQLSSRIKEVVNDFGEPTNVEIKFTGTPIIQQKLGVLINEDRGNTQWISTLFVFIITMFVFRSALSAVVPILVVFVSVNWLYGTMGYVDLPISTLAGGVAAMVIGIGIDFAIHLMNKFKFERKNGKSINDAVEIAVVQTGMALTVTSLTTMVAFLAFLVGLMPEMGKFGILMAMGIFYSLIFTLIGLPALLIIEEKIIYWVKQKMKFGIDEELELELVDIRGVRDIGGGKNIK